MVSKEKRFWEHLKRDVEKKREDVAAFVDWLSAQPKKRDEL